MSEDQPHYTGHRQRLRDRFLRAGMYGFAEHEVVELLLTLAVPRSDVKQPAKALLARFGSLRSILDAPVEDLRTVPGIGTVTPVALKIIKAAATLYLQQASEGRDSLAEPTRLADFWRMRIGAHQNEVFEVAYLDSANRLLRDGVEILGDRRIDVAEVVDAWLAPEYRYFKLRGADGNTYLVRHDERANTWELTLFRAQQVSE